MAAATSTPVSRRARITRRVVLIGLASLGVVILVSITVAEGSDPVPDPDTALASLQFYNDSEGRKPDEVDTATLVVLADEVTDLDGLIQAATGSNALGQPRASFTAFEVDPDIPEWRPVMLVDMELRPQGATTAVLQTARSELFVAFVVVESGSPTQAGFIPAGSVEVAESIQTELAVDPWCFMTTCGPPE